MRKSEAKRNCRLYRLAVSLLVGLWAATPGSVVALPNGGEIVSGTGSISQTAQDMVIQQNDQQLIANWQGFSIGSAESVTFKQPNSSAVALNRVIGADPSMILGKLSANGQVFLTNPSGVVFGAGSVVDVHGLLATTFSISDENFLKGNYQFTQDPNLPLASVINNGTIHARRYVGLSAPAVGNTGSIIVADLGILTEGYETATTLDFNGDGLISFAVAEQVSGLKTDAKGNLINDQINNSGIIQANGGQVLLTTQLARNVVTNVVNHSAIVEAQTVIQENGKIVLSSAAQEVAPTEIIGNPSPRQGKGLILLAGGAQGDIQLSGILDASKVVVRADAVAIAANKSLSTNNGKIKIVSNDLDLKGDLNSGTGNVVFVLANRGDLNLAPGNPKGSLGGNDIGHIIAKNLILRTRGNINVKGISEKNTAGISNSVILNSRGGDINFEGVASSFPALKLHAANDVNVNAGVTTVKGKVKIVANDLNLNADLNSGSSNVVFVRRKGQDLKLTSDGADGSLGGSDLSHIFAKNLILRTKGNIHVDGLNEKHTSGIKNYVIMNSRGGDINFEGVASSFPALKLRAVNDINVNTNITTTKSDFIAVADRDNNGQGDLNVAPGVVITSARDIDVSAPLINAEDKSFNETRDLIVNGDVVEPPLPEPPMNPVVAESIQQGSLGSFLTEFFENGGSSGGC